MNCALWLNRHKIYSADEIPDNFDIAALRGYFLSGSLVKWLRTHGGDGYADILERVSYDAPDLNNILAEVFGKKFTAPVCRPYDTAPIYKTGGSSFAYGSGVTAGSFPPGRTLYFGSGGMLGSFTLGGFGVIGSYSGSYRSIGSGFSEWEWEWLFRRSFGSFSYGSYSLGSYKGFGGSYSEWEWEWEFRRRYGSFRAGSFGSAAYLLGSFSGSFSFGSFAFGSYSYGSYKGFPVGSFGAITPEEYDLIMYACLKSCPLDRFGYGIHNI